jgi:DNA repair exonuclease SbcCD ATPase subunit
MRRINLLIFMCFGVATVTFAQTTPSDSQTLQSLLTEVRELRQVLQVSLIKMQRAQILLSRLQIEEVAVTRASQHLDDSRSRLAEAQLVLKSEAAEIKHLEEDPPNGGETPSQVEDALRRVKSDLENAKNEEQKRQTIETDTELQLRTEKDKLSTLESQLDELVREMGDSTTQSGRVPH